MLKIKSDFKPGVVVHAYNLQLRKLRQENFEFERKEGKEGRTKEGRKEGRKERGKKEGWREGGRKERGGGREKKGGGRKEGKKRRS
jgi:hypothetical protein